MDILRGGWAPGLLGNGAGLQADSPSTGGYSTEAQAIFTAFTTPPTTARKNLIDAAVVSLKSAGVWAKLDALYAFAAADSQAAKINWKAPGTFNATEVNAPAFAADLGFTGASTAYLDSNLNPTTATTPNWTQNSAVASAWSLTDAVIAAAIVGDASSTAGAVGQMFIMPKYSGSVYYGVINHNAVNGAITAASANGTGFWSVTRTAAAAYALYRNGALLGSGVTVSDGIYNGTKNFLRRGAEYWTGQIAAGALGGALNATEQTALYNALNTYITGLVASSYQAETEAIAAAFTTPPTTARKNLIDAAVVSLKTAGVWAKLDCLYLLAAADSQAATINWKSPGSFNLTLVNSPTFTVDLGFAGDGSTKYLDSVWDPTNNVGNFVQNSASLHVWNNTETRANSANVIGVGASPYAFINPWNLAVDSAAHGLNVASSLNTLNVGGPAVGMYTLSRTGSANYTFSKNGTSLGTQATASSGLTSTDFRILHATTGASSRQIAFGAWGGGLTAGEVTDTYNALRTYMTGVGVP